MGTELRVSVAMSLMRALWGEVTNEMRVVLARLEREKAISIEFYINGSISRELAETASYVEAEVIADFPSTLDISHGLIRLDAPAKVPIGDGILVFSRKEPG